jgi:hypothetical protein
MPTTLTLNKCYCNQEVRRTISRRERLGTRGNIFEMKTFGEVRVT